jgi:hypothetical protein
MIQSQVVNNGSGNGFYSTGRSSNVGGNFNNFGDRFGVSVVSGGSGVTGSRVGIDPMKESTINYMKSIYRGIPSLSEDRLRNISQNFMRLYGTDREIT